MPYIKRNANYINFSDLEKMNDADKILVCRIAIQNTRAITCLRQSLGQEIDPKKLAVLAKMGRELMKADDDKNHPVYGIEVTVKDIKTVFTPEDFSHRHFTLPREKQIAKNPEKDLNK